MSKAKAIKDTEPTPAQKAIADALAAMGAIAGEHLPEQIGEILTDTSKQFHARGGCKQTLVETTRSRVNEAIDLSQFDGSTKGQLAAVNHRLYGALEKLLRK